MEGKYSLTENVMNYNGRKVYQIKALKDFGDVKAGELGGWIGNEKTSVSLEIVGFQKMP